MWIWLAIILVWLLALFNFGVNLLYILAIGDMNIRLGQTIQQLDKFTDHLLKMGDAISKIGEEVIKQKQELDNKPSFIINPNDNNNL